MGDGDRRAEETPRTSRHGLAGLDLRGAERHRERLPIRREAGHTDAPEAPRPDQHALVAGIGACPRAGVRPSESQGSAPGMRLTGRRIQVEHSFRMRCILVLTPPESRAPPRPGGRIARSSDRPHPDSRPGTEHRARVGRPRLPPTLASQCGMEAGLHAAGMACRMRQRGRGCTAIGAEDSWSALPTHSAKNSTRSRPCIHQPLAPRMLSWHTRHALMPGELRPVSARRGDGGSPRVAFERGLRARRRLGEGTPPVH